MNFASAENDKVFMFHLELEPGETYDLNQGRAPYGEAYHNSFLNFGCCAGELLITHPTLPDGIHVPEIKHPYDCMLDPREQGVIYNNLAEDQSQYYCFGTKDGAELNANIERIILATGEQVQIVSQCYLAVIFGIVSVAGKIYGPHTLFTLETVPHIFTAHDPTFLAVCYFDDAAPQSRRHGAF